jgi:hypothetical protein
MTEEKLKRELATCVKLDTTTNFNCRKIFRCFYRALNFLEEEIETLLDNAIGDGTLQEKAEEALEKLRRVPPDMYQENNQDFSLDTDGDEKYPLPPYKGNIEGFPEEVVWKMLDRQEEQGNKRDVTVFEWNRFGGFIRTSTSEGEEFWLKVFLERNFKLFFVKYPDTSSEKKFFVNCTGTAELLPFRENRVWIEPLPEETTHSRFMPQDKMREIIRKETKQKFKTTEVKAVSFTQINKTKKLWQLS